MNATRVGDTTKREKGEEILNKSSWKLSEALYWILTNDKVDKAKKNGKKRMLTDDETDEKEERGKNERHENPKTR